MRAPCFPMISRKTRYFNTKNTACPKRPSRAASLLSASVFLFVLLLRRGVQLGTSQRDCQEAYGDGDLNHGPIFTRPRVYLCGYTFWRFCEAVFPDYQCFQARPGAGDEHDVLLVGMHRGCEVEGEFPGKRVYINGEPDAGPYASTAYYLGPVQRESNNSMQLYFSSVAALKMPFVFTSFTERPRNSQENFLIYISRRCLSHRENAFNMFSTLGIVTAGGACRGDSVQNETRRDSFNFNIIDGAGDWSDAYKLYSRYKFGLVMENTRTDGYISEKILNAFAGGTVPIYYGTEDVFQVFNADAFVYFNDSHPEAALQKVKELLESDQMYEDMLSQPILAPGAYEKYFSMWGWGEVSLRIRDFLGIKGRPCNKEFCDSNSSSALA